MRAALLAAAAVAAAVAAGCGGVTERTTTVTVARVETETRVRTETVVRTRTVTRPAPKPPPPATADAYVTAEEVMQAFQENGIEVAGSREVVLDVICGGTGYAEGVPPNERHHIFECYVTTARRENSHYRVTTTDAGGDGGFRYQYQPVG